VASAGQLVSDIVSLHWHGDVDSFSSQVVTFTVLVDPGFRGAITNTAIISHPDLRDPVVVEAVAYVTDRPELRISKRANPSPVSLGEDLAYALRVLNLGQQATSLVVTDVLPTNITYVEGSATDGGELVGDHLRWIFPVLQPGERRTLGFKATVQWGREVINDAYAVVCAEAARAVGAPVLTPVRGGRIYLPLIFRQ
jgi:uncharacterized repeat protein (TIGR01451 family)